MSLPKRCISILTTAALIITTVLSSEIHCTAAEINERVQGNYGDNIHYTYFRDNLIGSSSLSVLTLTGLTEKNKIPDLTSEAYNALTEQLEKQPWVKESLPENFDEIASESENSTDPLLLTNNMRVDQVMVGENITELGNYCFANYESTFYLNKNITKIPEGCFAHARGCNIYIYGDLTSVETDAFKVARSASLWNIYVTSTNSQNLLEEKMTTTLKRRITVIPDMVDLTSLRIAINNARTEERLNSVSKYPRYTASSDFTAYINKANEANEVITSYNEEDGTQGQFTITETEANTYLKAINDAAKDLVSLEERNQALYKAEAMPTWRYTEESVKALQAAMETAKKVADNATKDDVAKLTKGVNDAIDNLQPISKEDAQKMFTATLDNAKNLIESDYEEEGWTTLQDIIKAEGTVAGNATAGAILDSRQNIINAVSSLVPVYSDPSPLAEFFSGDTNTLIIEGIADSTLAGAKRAVIEFDCASDVSYNPYSSIDLAYQIGVKTVKTVRRNG